VRVKDAAEQLEAFWAEIGVETDPEIARALKRLAAEQRRARLAARPRPGTRPQDVDPVAEAETAAAGAKTLEELFAAIGAFQHCPLKASAQNTVTHDGPLGAPVMVIGEGPGREEDRLGKPFVGRAGQLLDRMLASIGLSRETNSFITNVNYWRPPNNADPAPEVLKMTRPFVLRMVELKQPDFVILAGKVPLKALLNPQDGIMKLRGQEFALTAGRHTAPVIPIFHPAFLLRQPKMKRLAWEDLLRIEARLAGLGVGAGSPGRH